MHCFHFYVPQIVNVTYGKHGLGIGIFTMPKFERRNEESKKNFLDLVKDLGAFLLRI